MPAGPGVGHVLPERRRDGETAEDLLVADGPFDHREAHLLQFLQRVFQIVLDLAKRKAVVRAFVPVGIVVDGVEIEAVLARRVFPVLALGDVNALHGMGRLSRSLA